MDNLFGWDDDEKNVKPIRRPRPPVPPTDWKRPAYFPDLSQAKAIAFDLESWDPELLIAGPGWARGVGHILGISVATDCGFKGYFPMRHEDGNMDPRQVLAWANRELGRANQVKVGANLTYDVGWLRHEGVTVEGQLYDVQFAEALIEEGAQQNLEALGQKYLGMGKDSNTMYKWLADAYGGEPNGTQRANMYRCPTDLAGPYAESDSVLPLQIIKKQWHQLMHLGLMDVFLMECDLIRCMIDMRFNGMKVDVDKAKTVKQELDDLADQKIQALRANCGFLVNPNSAPDLAKAFDKFGFEYPSTATGKPSFTAPFLKGIKSSNPLASEILEIRELTKMSGTFIRNAILGKNVDNVVYPSFKQLKSEGGGTVSGRFGCSTPNVQQIPARTALGKRIRELFIPHFGRWRSMDYSSIEYRFLAHFAQGPGADDLRQKFHIDKFADFHTVVMDMINEIMGDGFIARGPTKTVNFALCYGSGVQLMATNLGITKEEAQAMVDAYMEALPYTEPTLAYYSNNAGRLGVVETIMGRRATFTKFVPSRRGGRNMRPLEYAEAVEMWGSRVERVGLHKAVNRVLQGSAADLCKKAMLDSWKEGLFAGNTCPTAQVHDELTFSDDMTSESNEKFRRIRHIMENCMPQLKVPIVVATDVGPNWGTAKEIPYDSPELCAVIGTYL